MTMVLPQFIQKILAQLQCAGFEAYLVGGCVRDAILGKAPSDWDITTNALPQQVMDIFPHCVPTGMVHGTVTVIWEPNAIAEVTTYRSDGIYEDGRHPKQVTFSSSLSEDLSRRDFTMNAIAYSPSTGFVDLFHGQAHLQQKKIYCVGDPTLRFSEDALRMLRALRFAAVLHFSLDSAIIDAIAMLHPTIQKVSIERIQEEFSKMLLAGDPCALNLLEETGLLHDFLPEITEIPFGDAFRYLPTTLPCRLALLLSKLPIQTAKSILKRMRYSNGICNQTLSILKNMDLGVPKTETSMRQRMSDKNTTLGLLDYLQIQQVLQPGIEVENALSMHTLILERKDCISLSSLAVNGDTLTELGIAEGQKKGTILQTLLQAVLENPNLNTKEQLIDIVSKIR